MSEEKKQFPTPAMPKAEEKREKMSPERLEALDKAFREKLRKYYAGHPSREMRKALMEEEQQE